jgi:hypothetical protein
MGIKKLLIGTLAASLCLVAAMTSSFAGEKQKYYFMVYSNAVNGEEETYLKWYEGQHIHDLLGIPGFVAAQFFKLSDTQYSGTPTLGSQRYLMIWEIETDDLAAVFADVSARLKDGRTVFTDAFDRGTSNSTTLHAITKRVTAEEIKGKSIDEVEAIAKGE